MGFLKRPDPQTRPEPVPATARCSGLLTKNGGTILGADDVVGALAVQGCGIMHPEEVPEQFGKLSRAGSNSIWIASACPVRPVHTCS